ncbi:MAG: response regulator transcription factor [Thermostichales cyanobacterium BF4_bins_65]
MTGVRVVIADDHPLFRLGLRYSLQGEGFEVLAEAESGSQAVQLCGVHRPDVVILDVKMPDQDGLQACQSIRRDFPAIVVVVLTTFQEPALVAAAQQAGARGFFSKDTQPHHLAGHIRQLLADPDHVYLPTVNELPRLTPRELTVIRLLSQGFANKQIARQLGLSIETVKEYASTAYRKLGASDRVTALFRAQQLGLLEEHP